MNTNKLLTMLLVLMGTCSAVAQTVGTSFTYQGQLLQSTNPIDGDADFIFRLFDASTGGTQIGSDVPRFAVPVDRGVFTVDLDFGSNAFDGDARYLQISVRSPASTAGGGEPYDTLLPRQELTPVPYAMHALNVAEGGGWELSGSSLSNTNGGFVGINGSSPLTPAEVFGVRSDASTGYGGMYMSMPTQQGQPFYGFDAGGLRAWTYLDGNTASWRLFNGGDRLYVLNNGNVGIGRATPTSRLEVAGAIHSTTGGFKFPDGTVQTSAATGGGGGSDADWVVDGTKVYNDTADDVMIGTNAPANGAKLTVAGGDFGLTTIDVNGNLGGTLKLRGSQTSFQVFTAVDETRMSASSGSDVSLLSGRNLFVKAGTEGFQQFYTDGVRRMRIDVGGTTDFFHSNNNATVSIDGEDPSNGGGLIELRKGNGTKSIEILGANANGAQAGSINMYTDTNSTTPTVTLDGEYGGTAGGALVLRNSSGQMGIELVSDLTPNEQPEIRMFKPNGQRTIEIEAEEAGSADQGSTIKLFDDSGNLTIELDADYGASNEGRIITEVIEITGGSDLSEQFDVFDDGSHAIEPGSVVSIDPASPGDLRLSDRAYDRRVAGIISGAGGVKPGMLMGQRGSEADGQHPVALTGRVYCKVDATQGAIEPGDLLTTSPTPGHAMKVADHGRAAGAILGKAMTGLDSGTGMVLVLVSLQ
mgnify:CR=1 FL=1